MDKLSKVQKEIEELREKIRRADYYYYVLSEPEISDEEYDNLMRKLIELEKRYPQFVSPDSPTQRVSGGVLEGFPTARHKTKMLSLDNTYSLEELKEWEDKLKRMLKTDKKLDYVVELKIDGVSCSLFYEKGIFVLGATRGDGEIGEDVTPNLKTIKSIPLRLLGEDFPSVLEVRAEIYMEKDEFEKINRNRLKKGDPPFANPRNAASGSLKLLDTRIVSERNLRCFVHSFGWVEGVEFDTHWQFLERIKTWGLRVNPYNKYCRNLKEAMDYCTYWQESKKTLPYEIDGIVVKVNSFSLQKELGQTLKAPRWAVAYKFPAHQATTVLKKVEFGVGRTGIITPVAILKPVECGGVVIHRATLHNFEEIERLDVRVGDTVLVERAGEVIPKIVKVITSRRKGEEKKIEVPKKCPVCSGEVNKENVYLYCLNPNCSAQLKRSLIHFASRAAMDIEGLGESVVEELVNRGMVKSLVDIYKLKKEDFLTLPLFAEKKAENLFMAIQKSKTKGLARFLYGLGIRHIGEKAARVLAERLGNIDKFFHIRQEELESIPEVGPIMAQSLVKFFSQVKVREMMCEFKKLGVVLEEEKKKIEEKSPFYGKTVVFTGELEDYTRSQAQKLIEELGGRWSSSVSKNTDFVIVGKKPGSKLVKAKKLGVKVINEAEFKQMIG